VSYLITTTPMSYGGQALALVILEDITELTELRRILPICARCKKIRDDEQFWVDVASYFRKHSGFRFSHGICPECEKELYPDLLGD
jgi:hypothetical protein